jgi:hypothetical protein
MNKRVSRLAVPTLEITSFEVRCMPVDELHTPVREVPDFVDEIEDSIRVEGLNNPVIVVRGAREDLISEIESIGGRADSMPDRPVVNCVFGGTNRVTAAKRMGYTHIDCILLPSFILAIKLQEIQRNQYNASKRKERAKQ